LRSREEACGLAAKALGLLAMRAAREAAAGRTPWRRLAQRDMACAGPSTSHTHLATALHSLWAKPLGADGPATLAVHAEAEPAEPTPPADSESTPMSPPQPASPVVSWREEDDEMAAAAAEAAYAATELAELVVAGASWPESAPATLAASLRDVHGAAEPTDPAPGRARSDTPHGLCQAAILSASSAHSTARAALPRTTESEAARVAARHEAGRHEGGAGAIATAHTPHCSEERRASPVPSQARGALAAHTLEGARRAASDAECSGESLEGATLDSTPRTTTPRGTVPPSSLLDWTAASADASGGTVITLAQSCLAASSASAPALATASARSSRVTAMLGTAPPAITVSTALTLAVSLRLTDLLGFTAAARAAATATRPDRESLEPIAAASNGVCPGAVIRA
jgi:hypothetical protein